MNEPPELLLDHHLKKLKLPTFLAEYAKLARQCATENVDHIRYLKRLTCEPACKIDPISGVIGA